MRRRFLGEIKAKNNVLYYTSTDNLIIVPYRSNFGTIMINNEMSNNIGVMIFLADITTIGEYAFSDCNRLKSITIPDSVTSIGSYAFRGCTSLTSITIPDGVTLIENGTFYNCALTSVTIPDSIMEIRTAAFQHCTSLTSVTIPDSVTTIGGYAFYRCESLISVTIPDSVTTIGSSAFGHCYNLTSVYCKATKPPLLDGFYIFDYNGSGRKIYVPYQSLDVYKTAGWSRYAADIVGYDFENDTVVGGGLITFTVDGIEYQAQEGMTWEQWVSSEYSNDAFFIAGIRIRFKGDGRSIANAQGVFESKTNSIVNDYEYAILFEN